MRIFDNYLEACKEIERDLWELGAIATTKSVQDEMGQFETRELVGYQFCVKALEYNWAQKLAEFFFIDKHTLLSYVMREAEDRIHGAGNPGNSWEIRREVWEKYLHDGKFAYTYGERIWHPTNQLGHCKQVLQNDPSSRQAIVQIYDQNKDWNKVGGKSRIPCSLTYQFLSRSSDSGPKLHCIYTMRSCDFYKHFVYDMIIACELTIYLARELGWDSGNLIMQIGSLHAFRTDLDKRKIY